MAVDPGSLTLQPKRALDWEEDGEGRAVLLRPKFGSGKLGRWLQGLLNAGFYRIRLDPMGTLVWKSCDGDTPLSEVAQRLRRQFGDEIEPAEDRLWHFIRQMNRARLIEF